MKEIKEGFNNFNNWMQENPEESEKYFEGMNGENLFMHTNIGYTLEDRTKFKEVSGLDTDFVCVERYGGSERGIDYWSVYKINDVYVKFDGYYQSYDGAEFEEMLIVSPVEQTVTVWK
mgnify:CR=1 FL=1